MGVGEFVKLECRPESIGALAAHLTKFAALGGEPDWLVSAVWLRTEDADYLATPSTRVLSDGYIARPLTINRADDFVRELRSDLPDIATRLVGRRSDVHLPDPTRPQPPKLEQCPGPPLATSVLVRVATRPAAEHRIACGLAFSFEDRRLLVGTDPSTLALVMSTDGELIDRYVAACESFPAGEYVQRFGA